MEANIDQIINEVIRRIGIQKEAALIEGLEYSEQFMHKLQAYDLRRISSLDVLELPEEIPVYIPELKLGQMMAVFNGISNDAVSEATIVLLAQGACVHVLGEMCQIHVVKLGNTPYAKRFKKAYQYLIDAGLKIDAEIRSDCMTSKRRSLFTEKEAIKCVEDGMKRVTLPKGAIITPLALDYARYNNLRIEKE